LKNGLDHMLRLRNVKLPSNVESRFAHEIFGALAQAGISPQAAAIMRGGCFLENQLSEENEKKVIRMIVQAHYQAGIEFFAGSELLVDIYRSLPLHTWEHFTRHSPNEEEVAIQSERFGLSISLAIIDLGIELGEDDHGALQDSIAKYFFPFEVCFELIRRQFDRQVIRRL